MCFFLSEIDSMRRVNGVWMMKRSEPVAEEVSPDNDDGVETKIGSVQAVEQQAAGGPDQVDGVTINHTHSPLDPLSQYFLVQPEALADTFRTMLDMESEGAEVKLQGMVQELVSQPLELTRLMQGLPKVESGVSHGGPQGCRCRVMTPR